MAKVECLKHIVKKLNTNNPTILAEFYDFLAIGSLEKEFNEHIEITKGILEETLEKYFDEDQIDSDVSNTKNAKYDSLRASVFRFLTNVCKFKPGINLILEVVD